MPNYITTCLKFVGPQEDIEKIKKFVATEGRPFDFNTLIPMPESLDIEDGSRLTTFISVYKRSIDGTPLNAMEEENLESMLKTMTMEEIIAQGKTYCDNEKKYGHHTWYTWRIANWGTKWNAMDIGWEHKRVTFLTAWDPAIPVVKKLSQKFPTVSIEMKYADEDFGVHTGIMNFAKGECIEGYRPTDHTNDAYELAAEVIGGKGSTPRDFGYTFDTETYKWKYVE